jgi:hypothetical protein
MTTRSRELSASTGALVKGISGSSYGFNDASAIASVTHVRVANERNNVVTELSVSGGSPSTYRTGSRPSA